MGRAIVRQPQVFLFDEPLSNLDAMLRASTRLQIQQWHRELGIAGLLVTHDQVEAMTLAQRMMAMNAGKVEPFGTPEAVYHRPASVFVVSFIGAPPMNLLKNADTTPAGQWLGVRPEHLTIAADGWAARVQGIGMLGAERLLYCQCNGEALIVRVNETDAAPAIGAHIHVPPQAGKLHYLDATTGLWV